MRMNDVQNNSEWRAYIGIFMKLIRVLLNKSSGVTCTYQSCASMQEQTSAIVFFSIIKMFERNLEEKKNWRAEFHQRTDDDEPKI